jgi:hypothetical protein
MHAMALKNRQITPAKKWPSTPSATPCPAHIISDVRNAIRFSPFRHEIAPKCILPRCDAKFATVETGH